MPVEAQPLVLAIRPGGDAASPHAPGSDAEQDKQDRRPVQNDDVDHAVTDEARAVVHVDMSVANVHDDVPAELPACAEKSSSLHADHRLADMPNEVLLHILGYLDVNDLLAASRTNHHMRCLCLSPFLHMMRRRRTPTALRTLLFSPSRPSLAELISRHIFLTHTTVVSRKLARSLVSIRLSRRLAARPPAKVLVERCVLPPECAPGIGHVSPVLAARTRAVERERLKDGLRRWIGAVWKKEYARKCEETSYIGRVWRLRRFWERVARGEAS